MTTIQSKRPQTSLNYPTQTIHNSKFMSNHFTQNIPNTYYKQSPLILNNNNTSNPFYKPFNPFYSPKNITIQHPSPQNNYFNHSLNTYKSVPKMLLDTSSKHIMTKASPPHFNYEKSPVIRYSPNNYRSQLNIYRNTIDTINQKNRIGSPQKITFTYLNNSINKSEQKFHFNNLGSNKNNPKKIETYQQINNPKIIRPPTPTPLSLSNKKSQSPPLLNIKGSNSTNTSSNKPNIPVYIPPPSIQNRINQLNDSLNHTDLLQQKISNLQLRVNKMLKKNSQQYLDLDSNESVKKNINTQSKQGIIINKVSSMNRTIQKNQFTKRKQYLKLSHTKNFPSNKKQ